jgi:hypothetical protein
MLKLNVGHELCALLLLLGLIGIVKKNVPMTDA